MNLQDTPARYGAVSVFNHWLGAALIVALLAIGLHFEDMPRGDEKLSPARSTVPHMSR